MRLLAPILIWLTLVLDPAAVCAQSFEELAARLPDGNFSQRAAVATALAATGDERAAALLEALGAGELQVRAADGRLLRVIGRRGNLQAVDALTGEALGPIGAREAEPVRVNNALRRSVRAAIASLTLMHPDPARRRAAA